jgi:hypothetical protein
MCKRFSIKVFLCLAGMLAVSPSIEAQSQIAPGEPDLKSNSADPAPPLTLSKEARNDAKWIDAEQRLHEHLRNKEFEKAKKVVQECESLYRGGDPKRSWKICTFPQLKSEIAKLDVLTTAQRDKYASAIALATDAADKMGEGKFEAAGKSAYTAHQELEDLVGVASFSGQRSLSILVASYTQSGDYKKASEVNHTLIEIEKKLYGDDSLIHAFNLNAQALIFLRLHDVNEGERCVRKALEVSRALVGSESSEYTYGLCTLSEICLTRRSLQEADACAQHALTLSFIVGNDDELKARAYEVAARCHTAFGEHRLAASDFESSLSNSTDRIAELAQDRARRLGYYAESLRLIGNAAKALKIEADALSLETASRAKAKAQ